MEPSSWIRRHARRVVAGGAILDVACGSGRHSRLLSGLGYTVTGVDIDISRFDPPRSANGPEAPIRIVEANLEHGPWPFSTDLFDGIVVVNYLHRPLYPALTDTLARGGILLVDTFAAGNERFGRPRNPDYLLQPGELLRAFGPRLDVLAYQHGRTGNSIRQRICAVRR